MSDAAYWDDRSRGSYTYGGETFYTITPVPYYRARRVWLLAKLKAALTAATPTNVLDFGCGDGFYTRWAGDVLPDAKVRGYDLSPGMVGRAAAEDHNPKHTYTADAASMAAGAPYDAIVCIAVLAHVPTGEITAVLRRMHEMSAKGAVALIFEQTTEIVNPPTDSVRRSRSFYREAMLAAGWRIVAQERYCRPVFRFFCRWAELGYAVVRRASKLIGVTLSRNINAFWPAYYVLSPLERISRAFDERHVSQEGNTLFILTRQD